MEVHTPQSLEEKSTWGECPIEASALLWATESGHNLSQINTVLEELEAEGTHGNRKHKGTLKGFPQCEDADLINFFASRKPIRSPVTGTGFKTVPAKNVTAGKTLKTDSVCNHRCIKNSTWDGLPQRVMPCQTSSPPTGEKIGGIKTLEGFVKLMKNKFGEFWIFSLGSE